MTGGTLPLAATLCREEIFANFADPSRHKALLHGHTFSGNPVGCAAALATLQIYAKQNLIDRALHMEERLTQWLETQEDRIDNGRALGAVMAWELAGTGFGQYFSSAAEAMPAIARRHGLLLRPLGNTMYFVPPLSITPTELDEALTRIERCLDEMAELPQGDADIASDRNFAIDQHLSS